MNDIKEKDIITGAQTAVNNMETIYKERFEQKKDELHDLYMQLYGNDAMFAELCEHLYSFYKERSEKLKTLDKKREADPDWYKRNDLVGMMMYVNNFAHTLKGLEEHLDYVEECNVNYLHLMPLLASPKGKSDGGYAVADFRTVQPELGTMEDFSELTSKCHERGINICLDFVMNHTSEEHEWAKRARAGEKEYQDRYFFFDTYDVPALYEKTCPQVFPTTAPGNFTWLDDLHKHVMTTFYPYQWETTEILLCLTKWSTICYIWQTRVLTSYVSMQFLISGSSLEQTAATCHRFTQSYV